MLNVKINNQWDFILTDHRASRPEWTTTGWEKKRLNDIYNTLHNDIVFYIGAEEGEMPGLISQWGNDVVLFEPSDNVWANIYAIWQANNLKKPLAFFEGFLSNQDVSATVEYDWPQSSFGDIISDHGFRELCNPADIKQITLDTFVQSTKIIPTALCIDIEGSEGLAIKGAIQTIIAHHPTIWLSLHPEFMVLNYKMWGAELRQELVAHGYTETIIDYPFHELHLKYEYLPGRP